MSLVESSFSGHFSEKKQVRRTRFLLKALVLLLAAKKASWEEYLGQVQNRRDTYLPSHLLPRPFTINSGID